MDNVVSITDCSDDLQAVSMECKKGKNTLIVYGHGVREPASELTEGAQSIEGAKSMIQIREKWFKNVGIMLKNYKNLDEDSKKMIGEIVRKLLIVAKDNFVDEMPSFGKKK